MDDEMKALKATERARRAQLLLDDELLQEAFAKIDGELIARWRTSSEPEARDRVWQASQMLNKVQEVLRLMVTNGRVAKRVLDDLEGKRKVA